MYVKPPLTVTFLEEHDDGVIFYEVKSPDPTKGVLQVETGIIYGGVAITDDDPHHYEEADIPEDERPIEEEEHENE